MQVGTAFGRLDLAACKESAAGPTAPRRLRWGRNSVPLHRQRASARFGRGRWSRRSCDGRRAGEQTSEEAMLSGEVDLPSQGEAAVRGVQEADRQPEPVELLKQPPGVDYLAELIAIQKNGPKNIGFFGTRNMGYAHQQLVEMLSFALIIMDNHIFTSGATGTNAAVIHGALRAGRPDLLTVILPQSLSKQPEESQELLKQVQTVEANYWNDGLSLYEASRLCNNEILNRVEQVICFAYHDSRLMLETCKDAKEQEKIVTLFYLD